jgi:anionic cell wall polymer biosynthesis LytR-Cps2A-Psr (LCP) family protein
MDGKTALKYVRSRKANNDQGTDFARSIRQQQVIKALKNKFNKISLVQKVKKLIPLYMIGKEYIKTDLNLTELLILGKYLYGLNENNIKTVNLTDVKNEMQDGGLLIHPNTEEYDGQWVLIPISKDFSQIHEYIKCSIYSNCSLN